MRRKTFFIFSIFLISLNAISQNTIGLKAGTNLAYQSDIYTGIYFPHRTTQTKSFFGYQAGFFYKAKISSILSFSTEANFSLIGAKDEYLLNLPSNTDTYRYYNDKIGYIEVPLMMQYNLKKLYVSAGPAISFKLFSKSMFPSYTLDYRSFDLAGNLLGGYHVSQKWDVNLRYSYGLLNINEDPNIAAKKKNRYLNLSLLYALK